MYDHKIDPFKFDEMPPFEKGIYLDLMMDRMEQSRTEYEKKHGTPSLPRESEFTPES